MHFYILSISLFFTPYLQFFFYILAILFFVLFVDVARLSFLNVFMRILFLSFSIAAPFSSDQISLLV